VLGALLPTTPNPNSKPTAKHPAERQQNWSAELKLKQITFPDNRQHAP